jgi:shikimate kinase
VISTGGGIVENTENIEIMKKNGILFYLKAQPATLFERIKESAQRPMLFGRNPKERLEQLLEKREQLYKLADFEIDTDKKELLEIANEVLEKYEQYNG